MPIRILLSALTLSCLPIALAQDLERETLKYYNALKKKPSSVRIYERFYDAWMKSRTEAELQHFLEENAKSKNNEDLKLVTLYFKTIGKYKEAEKYLKQALSKYPADAALYQLLGSIYSKQKHYEEALVYFDSALFISHSEEDIYKLTKQVAQVYRRVGRNEDAIRLWTELCDSKPHDKELKEDLIDFLQEEGLFKEAVTFQVQLFEQTKDTYQKVVYQLQLGDLYFKLKNKQKALETYNATLEKSGSNSWLERESLSKIILCYELFNYEKNRIDAFVELTKKHPQRLTIKEPLLEFYLQKEDYKAAETTLLSMMRVNPSHSPYTKKLANIYRLSKQPQKAIDLLKIQIKKNIKDFELYDLLATIYAEEKNTAELKNTIAAKISHSEKTEKNYLKCADLLLELKQKKLATEYYQKTLDSFPKCVAAAISLAEIKKEKREDFSPLLSNMAKHASVDELKKITSLLNEEEKFTQAFKLLQQEAVRFPKRSDFIKLHFHQATLAEEHEEAEKLAIHLLNKASTMNEFEESLLKAHSAIISHQSVDNFLEKHQKSKHFNTRCLVLYIHFKYKDFALAHQQLDVLAKTQNPKELSYVATLFALCNDIDSAIECYQRIITLPKGNRPIYLERLVHLFEHQKNYAEAENYLEKWLRISPNNIVVWSRKITLQHIQDKLDEAIKITERAVHKFASDTDLKEHLIALYLEAKRYPDAQKAEWDSFEAIKDHQKRLARVRRLVSIYKYQQKISELDNKLKHFSERSDHLAQGIHLLTEFYKATKNEIKYNEQLSLLKTLRPNDSSVTVAFIQLQLDLGKYDIAIRELKKMDHVDPFVVDKLYDIYTHLGMEEEALGLMKHPTFNQDPDVAKQRITDLMHYEKWDLASKFLDKALKKHPQHVELLYLGILCSHTTENYHQLLKITEKAFTLPPQKSTTPSTYISYVNWGNNMGYLTPSIFFHGHGTFFDSSVHAKRSIPSSDFIRDLMNSLNVVRDNLCTPHFSFKPSSEVDYFLSGHSSAYPNKKQLHAPTDSYELQQYCVAHLSLIDQEIEEREQWIAKTNHIPHLSEHRILKWGNNNSLDVKFEQLLRLNYSKLDSYYLLSQYFYTHIDDTFREKALKEVASDNALYLRYLFRFPEPSNKSQYVKEVFHTLSTRDISPEDHKNIHYRLTTLFPQGEHKNAVETFFSNSYKKAQEEWKKHKKDDTLRHYEGHFMPIYQKKKDVAKLIAIVNRRSQSSYKTKTQIQAPYVYARGYSYHQPAGSLWNTESQQYLELDQSVLLPLFATSNVYDRHGTTFPKYQPHISKISIQQLNKIEDPFVRYVCLWNMNHKKEAALALKEATQGKTRFKHDTQLRNALYQHEKQNFDEAFAIYLALYNSSKGNTKITDVIESQLSHLCSLTNSNQKTVKIPAQVKDILCNSNAWYAHQHERTSLLTQLGWHAEAKKILPPKKILNHPTAAAVWNYYPQQNTLATDIQKRITDRYKEFEESAQLFSKKNTTKEKLFSKINDVLSLSYSDLTHNKSRLNSFLITLEKHNLEEEYLAYFKPAKSGSLKSTLIYLQIAQSLDKKELVKQTFKDIAFIPDGTAVEKSTFALLLLPEDPKRALAICETLPISYKKHVHYQVRRCLDDKQIKVSNWLRILEEWHHYLVKNHQPSQYNRSDVFLPAEIQHIYSNSLGRRKFSSHQLTDYLMGSSENKLSSTEQKLSKKRDQILDKITQSLEKFHQLHQICYQVKRERAKTKQELLATYSWEALSIPNNHQLYSQQQYYYNSLHLGAGYDLLGHYVGTPPKFSITLTPLEQVVECYFNGSTKIDMEKINQVKNKRARHLLHLLKKLETDHDQQVAKQIIARYFQSPDHNDYTSLSLVYQDMILLSKNKNFRKLLHQETLTRVLATISNKSLAIHEQNEKHHLYAAIHDLPEPNISHLVFTVNEALLSEENIREEKQVALFNYQLSILDTLITHPETCHRTLHDLTKKPSYLAKRLGLPRYGKDRDYSQLEQFLVVREHFPFFLTSPQQKAQLKKLPKQENHRKVRSSYPTPAIADQGDYIKASYQQSLLPAVICTYWFDENSHNKLMAITGKKKFGARLLAAMIAQMSHTDRKYINEALDPIAKELALLPDQQKKFLYKWFTTDPNTNQYSVTGINAKGIKALATE